MKAAAFVDTRGLEKLHAILTNSEAWIVKIMDLLNGAKFPPTARHNVAVSLLTLSIEHYKGIHILAENLSFAPALALMRPSMEAYQRGLWVYRCATDEEIQAVLTGERFSGDIPKRLRDAGVLVPPISEASLSETWSLLCDFSHGGEKQIKGRMALGEIRQNIKPAYVGSIVRASIILSWLSARSIAHVCENTILLSDLDSHFSEIFPDEMQSALAAR